MLKQRNRYSCWDISRTHLCPDEQVGDGGGVLLQLRNPFLSHVLETGRVDHGEADEEDVGHRVGQRPETVIVLLGQEKTPVKRPGLWTVHSVGLTCFCVLTSEDHVDLSADRTSCLQSTGLRPAAV